MYQKTAKYLISQILFVLFGAIIPSSVFAQTTYKIRSLSHSDSVTYHRYIDSLNNCELFAYKRQLYFDSALSLCPWNAHLWQQKAMPLYKSRKYELGLPCLDSAVKYDQRSYIDYRAFMTCIFQKNYRAAINDFFTAKQIIGESYVMDHTFDFYIGLSNLQLNKLDSADFWLSKTIGVQKAKYGAKNVHYLDWFYAAMVAYEREDYPTGTTLLDNALSLYRNFSDAKAYKAICLMKMQRNKEALDVMTEAEQDFKQGYTINEDNAVYEYYPYQIYRPKYYTSMLSCLAGLR